jgi:hypothetical protein
MLDALEEQTKFAEQLAIDVAALKIALFSVTRVRKQCFGARSR